MVSIIHLGKFAADKFGSDLSSGISPYKKILLSLSSKGLITADNIFGKGKTN